MTTLQLSAEQLRGMQLEEIVPLLNSDNILDVIFKLDVNSLSVSERDPETGDWVNPDADILLDKQGYAKGGANSLDDAAPNPLFYHVSDKGLSTRTFKAFAAMFDNYDAYVNREERLGPEEMAEINELLDSILETKCMKIAYYYITKYLDHEFSYEDYRSKLFRMWFYLHTLVLRAGKVPRAVRMRRQRFEGAVSDRYKAENAFEQRKIERAQAEKKYMAYVAQRASIKASQAATQLPESSTEQTKPIEKPKEDVEEAKVVTPEDSEILNAFDDETEARLKRIYDDAKAAAEEAEKKLNAAIKYVEECQAAELQAAAVSASVEIDEEGKDSGDQSNSVEVEQIDYCSGFEHVFMGEISIEENESIGHVLGYHSWLKFYFDERAQLIDYLGTKFSKNSIANAGAPFMCVKFRWDQDGLVFVKERGSFFVGCSPEFSIAVATVCFFETETQELIKKCGWEVKAEDRFIKMREIDGFKFDYYICKDKEYLVSCFEELIGVSDERRVRKRQQKLCSKPIVRKPRVKVDTEWKRYCRENMRKLQEENPSLSDREAYALVQANFEAMTAARDGKGGSNTEDKTEEQVEGQSV